MTHTWVPVRYCTDIGSYELVVEQQKTSWNCDQKVESWKWRVDYHGAVVAQGMNDSCEKAQVMAVENVPQNAAGAE
jgi:hypothetical protein